MSEEYVTREEHEALKKKFEELERKCSPYMPPVSPHRPEEVKRDSTSTAEENVVSVQVDEDEEP